MDVMDKPLFRGMTSCGAIFALITSAVLSGCGADKAVEYDTNRAYYLPYASGRSFGVVQGSFTGGPPFSHQNEISYDFKMMAGTVVLAARSGEVTEVIDSNSDACTDGGCANNLIYVVHNDVSTGGDSSEARYLHLQKNGACVKKGDNVSQGDIIALSGDVGRSIMPHLHFQIVPGPGQTLPNPTGPVLATDTPRSFVDVKGDGVPSGSLILPPKYTSANMPGKNWCSSAGVPIPDQESNDHKSIAQNGLCLQAASTAPVGDTVEVVSGCLGGVGDPRADASRRWIFTDEGYIRSAYGLCVSVASASVIPELQSCSGDDSRKWEYDVEASRIKSILTGECLDFSNGEGGALSMSACDLMNDFQNMTMKDL